MTDKVVSRHPVWVPLFGMLLVAGNGQVIHSGEQSFVITVTGTSGIAFRGSYLVSPSGAEETRKFSAEGIVPAEFRTLGTNIYLSFQKQTENGALAVDISKDGTAIKRQTTEAPYGVVTLVSSQPSTGAPRQTEFRIEGSVKFAAITMTSETGDIEQELVPVPFTKTFFPRAGWFVGLSAQKTRVAKPNPVHIDRTPEVQDDGVSGSVHVAILENGSSLAESSASNPYGIASVAIRLP